MVDIQMNSFIVIITQHFFVKLRVWIVTNLNVKNKVFKMLQTV